METPAECGADIAVGEAQPLGLDLAFGGPYLGYMAANKAMFRKLPGRIVGQTHDVDGNVGYVLTLTEQGQVLTGSALFKNQLHFSTPP